MAVATNDFASSSRDEGDENPTRRCVKRRVLGAEREPYLHEFKSDSASGFIKGSGLDATASCNKSEINGDICAAREARRQFALALLPSPNGVAITFRRCKRRE